MIMLFLLILAAITVVIIIMYVTQPHRQRSSSASQHEGFSTKSPVLNMVELVEKIAKELEEVGIVKFPHLLTDMNNLCPQWEQGSSCVKLDTNYVCSTVQEQMDGMGAMGERSHPQSSGVMGERSHPQSSGAMGERSHPQ
jgi:hypothetical protein